MTGKSCEFLAAGGGSSAFPAGYGTLFVLVEKVGLTGKVRLASYKFLNA